MTARRKPRGWTEAEVATLRELYPLHPTAYVAARCGHPTGSTHLKAFALGIKKAPEFYRRPEALATLQEHGMPFQKGYTPANAMHHLPPPLRATMQALGKLQRTIRRAEQNRGLAQSPVRNHRGPAR